MSDKLGFNRGEKKQFYCYRGATLKVPSTIVVDFGCHLFIYKYRGEKKQFYGPRYDATRPRLIS